MNILEQQVLRLIGESTSSPDVFVDTDSGIAPVRDSINDCISELSMLTGGYVEEYYIPLQQEKIFYRLNFLSGNFGWVREAWLINQRRRLEQTDLHTLNIRDPRWMVHTGTPESYLQIGLDTVGVVSKPGGNNDVLQLTMTVIPAAYSTDTGRVKLLKQFEWAAVNYAVSEYYAGRGDAKTALIHWDRYLEVAGPALGYQAAPDKAWQLQTRKEPWPSENQRRP